MQGGALIWVGLAGLDTAEQRGQGRHKGTGENSSVLLLGAEVAGHGGVDEREQGGLGGPKSARSATATRRCASGRGGEVDDGNFAKTPLPPFLSCFSLFLFSPVAFLGFIWGT